MSAEIATLLRECRDHLAVELDELLAGVSLEDGTIPDEADAEAVEELQDLLSRVDAAVGDGAERQDASADG